jgi:hypothetical protein
MQESLNVEKKDFFSFLSSSVISFAKILFMAGLSAPPTSSTSFTEEY